VLSPTSIYVCPKEKRKSLKEKGISPKGKGKFLKEKVISLKGKWFCLKGKRENGLKTKKKRK
jgi:hypothetical protein